MIRKHIFLNKNEVSVDSVFIQPWLREKRVQTFPIAWNVKTMKPPNTTRVERKRALLSEMMINDCHEYYHRQPLTSRKRFSAKNESTEEFNKISFFIFLFMFFLPSMGFLTLLTIKLVSSDSLAENDLLKRSPWPYDFSMEIRRP